MSDVGYSMDAKTFGRINFLMTIPKPTLFDERIGFLFQYKVRPGMNNFKTILVASSIKNAFGEVQKYNNGKQKLFKAQAVSFSMDAYKIKGLIKTEISFLYLCSDGQKCVIKYRFERTGAQPVFLGVERCLMTEEEKDYYIALITEVDDISNQEASTSNTNDNLTYTSNNNLLQEYVDALRKETIFLKNNGGKKHKVSNGKRLAAGKEGYSYQFEMESELFLPEDAPLVIDTNAGTHAEGSVLVCEEFQIIIIVNQDLGEKVFKAEIRVEPWKLLVAQVDRLSAINERQHPVALKLIKEGPANATKRSIANIPKGQEKVKENVTKNDITVVWGPPGTGKTYTMSDIAVDFIKNGKTVLIVSHSNVSVDGVIKKVAQKLRDGKQDQFLEKGLVLRYGYVRDAELSKDPYASSFNYAMNHCSDLKRQMEGLLLQKDTLKNEGSLTGKQLVDIEKKLGYLRGKIREQEKIYVAKAKLIGTTISKVTVDSLFKYEQYDLVMFDEVSMAYVTQLACAASFAKSKFLCVGDFMQLPPIAQDQVAKAALEKDIFEYLGITGNAEEMYYHPWLVMLDTQRRMYPDIAEFVNKKVYGNLLKNHKDTVHNNKHIVDSAPLKGHALNMIDLYGTYAAASKNADNSRFNILSAIVSFGVGLSSESAEVTSVGIITPYAAQMRLIRAMLKDYKSKKETNIVCSTVHQFQGSESDVIVFDAVESYPTSKAGFLMSKNLNSVKRLINVAITRARGKLINVGNSKFWLKEFANKKTHIYYQFIAHLTEKQNVVSCKDKKLQKYLASLNTGNHIKIYLRQDECLDRIKKDFDSAEHQIIISIPDGELKDEANTILELIKAAEKRGIQILMKSNTYPSLPDEWKKYCVASENALFPLVMIDGKTIWYGIPLSKGKFKVKDYGFATVCDILIRIKGESTIEMISSLSELTLKRIGNGTTPLLPKTSKEIGYASEGSENRITFPGWIAKKQFCPECKHHLVLTKGKTGKYYLRCPEKNCSHTEIIKIEMINHYIDMNNIVCPQDKGELTAKIGPYGVYISCNHGHTVKLEQI